MKRANGRSFELQVFPHSDEEFGVELREEANGAGVHRVVRSWGPALHLVGNHLLEALRASGYRTSDLKRTRRKPFALADSAGVRLGLALLTTKPLRKVRRLEEVAWAVRELSDDEAYYWYAKCTDAQTGRRAQRAFRDLVSDR